MIAAAGVRFPCAECRLPLTLDEGAEWQELQCPTCRSRQSVLAFPALRGLPGSAAPAVAPDRVDGQAACFFHAEKPAAVPCGTCGRFLCDLCDLRIDKAHICTLCLQAARDERAPVKAKAGPKVRLRDRTFLPQNAAILLAFYSPLSVIGLYVLFLTAPGAIWYSLRYWKHGGGVQRRGRWRFVVSLILAAIQLAGIVAIVSAIVLAWDNPAPAAGAAK